MGACGSNAGIQRITLPQPTEEQARSLVKSHVNEAVFAPDYFNRLTEKLKAYFRGEKVDFKETIDLSEATPFQQKVWHATRLIPYGRTFSYLKIACEIGKPGAARAIGQALGKNPLPIIVPCHRVLSSDGGLGGFTGGIEMKQYLLKLEGVLP